MQALTPEKLQVVAIAWLTPSRPPAPALIPAPRLLGVPLHMGKYKTLPIPQPEVQTLDRRQSGPRVATFIDDKAVGQVRWDSLDVNYRGSVRLAHAGQPVIPKVGIRSDLHKVRQQGVRLRLTSRLSLALQLGVPQQVLDEPFVRHWQQEAGVAVLFRSWQRLRPALHLARCRAVVRPEPLADALTI